MPGKIKKAKACEAVLCFDSVTNPEERKLEYLERRDRLRRVLMNRRDKSTKETNESGPEVSATQENLNDASNHEDEPTNST